MPCQMLPNKFIVLFCAVALSFAATALAEEHFRPINPTMDYVPQNIGVYDTYYENFKESDCRVCHGASTAEQHHGTSYALSSNCRFCHLADVFIEPLRNCKICHIDNSRIGNFGLPHHKSDLADSGQCNQCHLHVVETGTVEPPNYEPSKVTPTPYSCENCHWPSGDSPHKSPPIQDWRSWMGFPIPTTWPHGKENPQPIEADGPAFSGTLGIRPYKPESGTHHEIGGKVYPKCYNCHGTNPGSNQFWDANDPYLIRFCENCHSVDVLHSIQEHVQTNNIYTVDGFINQTVTANEKCMACHSDILQEPPPLPADIPVIGLLEPNFGPPGIVVNILPASGTCFNEDPINGLCSFGQRMNGDAVRMAQRDAEDNLDWVDVPIHLWSEHLIQIRVPDNICQPGETFLKIHKEGLGTSAFKVFNIREIPVLNALVPSVGNWDQSVDINGEGFGVKQEKIYQNGYGYSTYVELSRSTQIYNGVSTYRVTKYRKQELWNPGRLPIEIKELLSINTGNPVQEQYLYDGCWSVKVITDFFKDDGDGKYNYGMAGLDKPINPQGTGAGDDLLYRSISNSICFTVTKDPYINSISQNPASYGSETIIYGANFGSVKGKSIVKVWNRYKTRFIAAKIISWSSSEIKFIVPRLVITGYPKESWVQVVVSIAPKRASNFYPLTITAP